jgi:hypothetical protein
MSLLKYLLQAFIRKQEPIRRMELVKRNPVIPQYETEEEKQKRLRIEAADERQKVRNQWLEQCEVNFDESKSKNWSDAPVYMQQLQVHMTNLAESKALKRHWNKSHFAASNQKKSA